MKNPVHTALAAVFVNVFAIQCAASASLPDSLKLGLSLWLDAGVNVFEGMFNGNSGVVHWCDVRETFAGGESFGDHSSFAYPVASATTTTPYANLKGGLVPPTLRTDAATGKKYVDFGLYGNFGGGNNWMFIENGAGALCPVTSRSLFAVVSFAQQGNFGTVFGRIPALTSNSGATGYYFKRQPGAAGSAIANASAIMQNGETRLNGRRINPETETYGFDGLQVFSQVGPYCLSGGTTAPTFNTFFNDRNQGTVTQGGGRLHEVLVYDRVLSWQEREAVEAYLSEKWLGSAFETEASGVTGPVAVDPAAAATYSSDVVIGLDPLSNQVITVNGTKATLRAPEVAGAMDRPASPFDTMETNYVASGSFEMPAQAAGAFQAVVPDGWTKTSGTSYLAALGSAIYNPSASLNASIPDGSQCVGLQGGNAAISQAINVPADGLYNLSFYMTRRPGRSEGANNTRAKILVDGKLAYYGCVSTDSRGNQDLFKHYTVELPPLKKGEHTLALSMADNTSTDRSVLYDKVEVSPVAAGEFIHIKNAGFESSGPVAYVADVGYDAAVNNGASGYETENFGWTCPQFSIDGKGCHARIAQNSLYYEWDPASGLSYAGEPADVRDYRKLVLIRVGFASQTISVPRAGRLRFSMRYGGASTWGGSRAQKVAVLLGGEEIARTGEIAKGDAMRTLVQDFDWPSSGDFTLCVTNILETFTDLATVIDDLRLEYIDDVVFDSTRPEGSGATPAALGGGDSVSATLDVPSNGFYYVALEAAGLAIEDTSAGGVYNSYKYYPARARILVDGDEAARFTVETPDMTYIPVRIPYLKSGSHTISIEGVADATAVSGKVRIGSATLKPLAVDATACDEKDVKFILKNGATLNLDYVGSVICRGVRANGMSLDGIVGAADSESLTGIGMLDIRRFGSRIIVR